MPDSLRARAQSAADRSHVPYSGAAAGVAVLLVDGRWTAAPRLENASYPLTIPALQGALALAALAGGAPVAVASTAPLTPGDLAAIAQQFGGTWHAAAPDLARLGGAPGHGAAPDLARLGDTLPEVGRAATLELDAGDATPDTDLAQQAAHRAVVPASDFPVGAVVTDDAGRRMLGANVEDAADWTRGLCAERTALVAARAAGFGPVRRLTVACLRAPGGSPCGGCRQVIAELAPDAQVVIWQGDAAPQVTSAQALLPGAFQGDSLRR